MTRTPHSNHTPKHKGDNKNSPQNEEQSTDLVPSAGNSGNDQLEPYDYPAGEVEPFVPTDFYPSNYVRGKPKGKGSVSVIDFASGKVLQTWPVPGGGSPDMGGVSADGKHLWLSGRYDDVVYRFDTTSGAVDFIAVGKQPHGLAVWPQPGRYNLGHTGNLR